MIEVDGSYGEGGGQILRTSIALSCITGKAVKIYNIRANRPKPGLKAQHLIGIKTAKQICNAKVEGLKLGSTSVAFIPNKIVKSNIPEKIDIGTAGSITLLLQVILPIAVVVDFPFKLEIIGGTDVKWSPSVDYLKNVTLRAVGEMGGKISVKLIKRGYYPKGGGKVIVTTEPSNLKGITFKTKKPSFVEGVSHCSNLPAHVAKRQADSAKKIISNKGINVDIKTEVLKEYSTGSGITLWCDKPYMGSVSLGERGKRAEKVGEEAAKLLIEELKSSASLDRWVGDQLMVFAAIAGKTEYTVSEVTKHQISNAYVINKFLDDCIKIDEESRKITVK